MQEKLLLLRCLRRWLFEDVPFGELLLAEGE